MIENITLFFPCVLYMSRRIFIMSDDRTGEEKMTTEKTDIKPIFIYRDYTGAEHLPAAKLVQLATKANTENIFNVILEAYEYGFKKGLQQKDQAN